MQVLVTGSSGLIGSEAVLHFDKMGCDVIGVDNNMRKEFFGPKGDTTWNLQHLLGVTRRFTHLSIDIRDREGIDAVFRRNEIDVIIHCAAQPSHDKAREIPMIDFDVNAVGTVNLLEATRRNSPEAVFIFMSTNKVYGDAPNEVPLVELATRYDYADPVNYHGISETMRVDQTLHSLFGASKTSADVMAQEYGRYFGLKVGIFRGGCLTGPSHSGVELHGFLSYLVDVALRDTRYTVFGYKGKQVRDQIHSFDVIKAFDAFIANPHPGEVYNLGGGRHNSASVIECIRLIEERTGRPIQWTYLDQNRRGDHICYISDIRKFQNAYPEWKITRSLDTIIDELVTAGLDRIKSIQIR